MTMLALSRRGGRFEFFLKTKMSLAGAAYTSSEMEAGLVRKGNECQISASVCSNTVQKNKRILSELKEQTNILPKKLKTSGLTKDEEQPQNAQFECQHFMNEFKKLKFDFVQLQSHIKLLDHLENVPFDQWPSTSSCDEESKKTRSQLKDAKTEVSNLEERLQDFTKEVQHSQEALENGLGSLEKMLASVEDKATEVKQFLEAAKSKAVSELESSGVCLENFQENFAQQSEELESTGKLQAHCRPMLASMKSTTASIRREQQTLQTQLQEAKSSLANQRSKDEDRIQRQECKLKRCENATKILTNLTGIKEQSLEDDRWTLELTTDRCNTKTTDSLTALLTLHFKPGPEAWSGQRLQSATIDIDTMDISDLVNEAVRLNDVSFLISAVMKKLKSHAPLFMEVEQLRHQYAIDWVPEDGILRVILGDSAQIVCTLALATRSQGAANIQLKSIEGVKEHPSLEELKPDVESPRISDWLEYLQEVTKTF